MSVQKQCSPFGTGTAFSWFPVFDGAIHITSKDERVCSCRSGDENENSLILLRFYELPDVMENHITNNCEKNVGCDRRK